MWLYGGWWNWVNGIAGIVNIFCMTAWWGIYSSKDQKDMLWPDMTWCYILAYDLWNFEYTYNCLPTHSWYCGLALLLAPTFANHFWNKGGWIQNRANTLALRCMFAQVFPLFQDNSVFSTITSVYADGFMNPAVRPTADHGSMGKLIYGDTWYYAVSLPYDQARTIKTMGSVNLRLAKGFEQTIRMRVEHVSAEENGQAAVVLSCRKYLAQTTLLRHQAADVVLHTYEGLRVPSNALRVSETGVTGVYCVDGEDASFRPVELLYQWENYALVKPAEGASDTRTLRVGDEVIATAGELFDGKVIR